MLQLVYIQTSRPPPPRCSSTQVPSSRCDPHTWRTLATTQTTRQAYRPYPLPQPPPLPSPDPNANPSPGQRLRGGKNKSTKCLTWRAGLPGDGEDAADDGAEASEELQKGRLGLRVLHHDRVEVVEEVHPCMKRPPHVLQGLGFGVRGVSDQNREVELW